MLLRHTYIFLSLSNILKRELNWIPLPKSYSPNSISSPPSSRRDVKVFFYFPFPVFILLFTVSTVCYSGHVSLWYLFYLCTFFFNIFEYCFCPWFSVVICFRINNKQRIPISNDLKKKPGNVRWRSSLRHGPHSSDTYVVFAVIAWTCSDRLKCILRR